MAKLYPAVGLCIYCGSRQYDDLRKKLSDEHVIPLAAGGDIVLPEASCFRCQKLTWKPEEHLLKFSAKSFRIVHQYRSRRKYPKYLPLKDVNGTGEVRNIPVEKYPNGFALFLWPKPLLISGKSRNDWPMTKLWYDMDRLNSDREELRKIGIYSWKSEEISNEMVFRMFAKIGHSYLSAELGLGNFKPLLLEYILRKTNEIQKFIGGTESDEVHTDEVYQIKWEERELEGRRYAVVYARIFARQMGPTFQIVAGEL